MKFRRFGCVLGPAVDAVDAADTEVVCAPYAGRLVHAPDAMYRSMPPLFVSDSLQ